MSADGTIDVTLRIWRQKGPEHPGSFETYEAQNVSVDQSFLEMLDEVNEDLALSGREPVAFDHDCREGICGMCSQVINGEAHGPQLKTTVCQLHMRHFRDGDTIVVEPWRAWAFPVMKDLMVDRRSLDRLIQSGGFISAHTGGAPDGNAIPVPKEQAEKAMDAAECIACGACVAACPNRSAMLFVGAKVSHLALLPQGRVEAVARVKAMTNAMAREGFGNCSNHYECEAVCPKGIPVKFIAKHNREYLKAMFQ